ncbi:MAG: hypothetical protein AAF709_13005 [Pseudomonadota bacterium]
MKNSLMTAICVTAISVASTGAFAGKGLTSSTILEFANARTLFVADQDASQIVALTLPEAAAAPNKSVGYNLTDFSARVAKATGAPESAILFNDLAVHPVTKTAYISLTIEKPDGPTAQIVTADPNGKVTVIDHSTLESTAVKLRGMPKDGVTFWRNIPASTIAVTDMDYIDGKLYVSGMSTGEFASKLRVIPFPFEGKGETSSIEMYHAAHNQNETRAPIRAMSVVDIAGVPTVVAAYTCTPLVTIPIEALKDGAHVKGKTVAELGYGNLPLEVISFTAYNRQQQPEKFVLVVNRDMDADLISLSDLTKAAQGEGLSKPIPYLGASAGVRTVAVPLAGVMQAADQDAKHLLALRRDQRTGRVELVSYLKGSYFRLSDFISEYNFADYKYAPQQDGTRQFQNMLKVDEGYPDQVR